MLSHKQTKYPDLPKLWDEIRSPHFCIDCHAFRGNLVRLFIGYWEQSQVGPGLSKTAGDHVKLYSAAFAALTRSADNSPTCIACQQNTQEHRWAVDTCE